MTAEVALMEKGLFYLALLFLAFYLLDLYASKYSKGQKPSGCPCRECDPKPKRKD